MVCGEEVLPESRLALELSCCLQDSVVRSPEAKPLRPSALGRKLSCCLQDREGGVFDPEHAVVGGCALQLPDVLHGIAANNPGCETATSAGYPGTLADTPRPPRPSGGDNRRGVAAGSLVGYTPTAPADTSKAGNPAHSSGIAVGSYRRLSHPSGGFRNCCRVRYCVLAVALFVDYITGGNAVVLFRRQHGGTFKSGHDSFCPMKTGVASISCETWAPPLLEPPRQVPRDGLR